MSTRAWILLSGVAHGAFALLLSVVDAPAPGHVMVPASVPIDVAIVSVAAVAPEPAVEPPPAVESEVRETPRKPRRNAGAHEDTSGGASEGPMEPPNVGAPAPASDAPPVVLSPRAAALSMMEIGTAPGSDAGTPRPGPLRGDAQRTLEDALMSAVRHVDTRAEPVLKPKAGGGFLYEGNGFEATIESDGSVNMEDKFVHAKWIFRPTTGADGELAGFRIFELKYDIFGWLDRKMGNDPFRSERRWFMDHTRGLREQMIEHFHDKRVHSREGAAPE